MAALGATPGRLLGPEIELAGFLFESQVVHDLRVHAEPHRASVRFYRDNKGLEVDVIVEGAANLLSLRQKLRDDAQSRCGALLVVVADSPTYTRDDGVIVTSIGTLGP